MVSFSCENCGDVLTKKKLDPHRNQCRGASYTCLDCMVHFQGTDYRSHTSCMSEAQKYEGALYRDPKAKNAGRQQKQVKIVETAVVPRKAYVEDEADEGASRGAIAVIDVPPPAPSPPPMQFEDPAADVNVFDFLVTDESPAASSRALAAPASNGYENGHESQSYERPTHSFDADPHYAQNGYAYGHAPLEPSFSRYDSYPSLADPNASLQPPPYTTPGPKGNREEKERDSAKSDRKSSNKRKRHALDNLDTARARQSSADQLMADAAAPVLHSGLTGGLSRLLSRSDDLLAEGLNAKSPLSPLKRSKKDKESRNQEQRRTSGSTHKSTSTRHRDDDSSDSDSDRGRKHRSSQHRSSRTDAKSKRRVRRSSSSSDEHRRPARKQQKAIEYAAAPSKSSPPRGGERALVRTNGGAEDVDPAELFLSFVTKGPDSERGLSINKALKRYHREREVRGDREKEERDKELWKGLRVRRNEKGEVVLFF